MQDTSRATANISRIPVGVVAIGRNEGERLRGCLASVTERAHTVVYVDSGSTDGSVELARELGASVVELDLTKPFTAARARNEGLARLCQLSPELEVVQFVDGDCAVRPGWLELGFQTLSDHPEFAVVCGRRREIHPRASVYNQLSDMDWDLPVGESRSCGGDAMMRVAAVRDVGGYDETMVTGEDPDLSFRLRQQGHRILRINAEMTLHDAAMTRFSQWWRRSLRSGYTYADGATRHGAKSNERYAVRHMLSNWIWGLILPLTIVCLAWPSRGWSLVLLALYAVLFWRIVRYQRSLGYVVRDAWLYATFCVLSKFPQMLGQLRFWYERRSRRTATLIEYQ